MDLRSRLPSSAPKTGGSLSPSADSLNANESLLGGDSVYTVEPAILNRHIENVVYDFSKNCLYLFVRVMQVGFLRAMAELIVVRHGETSWNAGRRLQGQLETDLNESGKKQAHAVADKLAKQGSQIAAVYSSDLRRAADTANVIAEKCGLPGVVLRAGLRERHLGLLQGLTVAEARRAGGIASKAFFSDSESLVIPGGGESLVQLYERTQAALEEIAEEHQGQKVVVVTHGGVLRALHIHATGLPSTGGSPNASVNVFRISEDNQWRLLSWGDVEHLNDVGFLDSAFGGTKASG